MTQIGTKPLQVTLTPDPVKVYNVGTATIYYKSASDVSSTSNDGSIAANGSKVFSLPTWITAKEAGAEVRIEELDSPPMSPNYARAREKSEFYVTAVPFEVRNDGVTDDTKALQAAVRAGKECKAIIPPGLGCVIKEPIELPEQANLSGVNRETSAIIVEGNISALQTKGANRIERLEFQCKSEQSVAAKEMGAIDFSAGNPNNIWIESLRIGSNFYNGVYGVGSAEGGGVHLRDLEFCAVATRIKGMKGAAIVLGSKTKRLIQIYLDEIQILNNAKTEALTGIEINNCDSLHASRILAVNCKKGFVVGNSDTSELRTTNLFIHDAQADGCSTGFELANLTEGSRIQGCSAEAGDNGFILGSEVDNLTISGCSAFKNQVDGMKALTKTSDATRSVVISGSQFHNNGVNTEAERAGILFEQETGGFLLIGNFFGNPAPAAATQKAGIKFAKKVTAQLIGNRFLSNGTAPTIMGTESTVNGKASPTFEELTTTGLNFNA